MNAAISVKQRIPLRLFVISNPNIMIAFNCPSANQFFGFTVNCFYVGSSVSVQEFM